MNRNRWLTIIVVFIVAYMLGVYFPMTGQNVVGKLQSLGG